jgi:hypothetical protein
VSELPARPAHPKEPAMASTTTKGTVTYRSADGAERKDRPAIRVRSRYAAAIWRGLGGYIDTVHLPAGVELWAPEFSNRSGVPTDPRAMFGVVYRGNYYAAVGPAWVEVSE